MGKKLEPLRETVWRGGVFKKASERLTEDWIKNFLEDLWNLQYSVYSARGQCLRGRGTPLVF